MEKVSQTYYTEARAILSEANFNLRSWASNSNQLCTAAMKDKAAVSSERVNILGLVWYTINDTVLLSQKSSDLDQSPATKC